MGGWVTANGGNALMLISWRPPLPLLWWAPAACFCMQMLHVHWGVGEAGEAPREGLGACGGDHGRMLRN